jgi:hypothetical protein
MIHQSFVLYARIKHVERCVYHLPLAKANDLLQVMRSQTVICAGL